MHFTQTFVPIVIPSGGCDIDFENMSDGGRLTIFIIYCFGLFLCWGIMGLITGQLSKKRGWKFWVYAIGWPAVWTAGLCYALYVASKGPQEDAADRR